MRMYLREVNRVAIHARAALGYPAVPLGPSTLTRGPSLAFSEFGMTGFADS
jgi:hypothetical protein